MTKLHTDRQITVASILLLLLAAFVVNPLEYPSRTQVRHRTARAVRADDHDNDQSRLQAQAFDLNHTDAHGDSFADADVIPVSGVAPQFLSGYEIYALEPLVPELKPAYHDPSRAPPSFFTN